MLHNLIVESRQPIPGEIELYKNTIDFLKV